MLKKFADMVLESMVAHDVTMLPLAARYAATESCFVPAAMIEMHNRTLRPEMFAGRNLLFEMPAVSVTCQLQGPGGGTPWVAD